MSRRPMTTTPKRLRKLQLASELAGGAALTAAGFCVSVALGLFLLGAGLILLGNVRIR